MQTSAIRNSLCTQTTTVCDKWWNELNEKYICEDEWVNYLRLFALASSHNNTPAPPTSTSSSASTFVYANKLLARYCSPLDHQIYFISFNRSRMNHRNEWVIFEIEVFHLRGKCVMSERFTSLVVDGERSGIKYKLQSQLMELCWICCYCFWEESAVAFWMETFCVLWWKLIWKTMCSGVKFSFRNEPTSLSCSVCRR